MAFQADVEVLEALLMRGNAAVKRGEELQANEEGVDDQGVEDDDGEFIDGLVAWVEFGELSDEQSEQDQQSRTG